MGWVSFITLDNSSFFLMCYVLIIAQQLFNINVLRFVIQMSIRMIKMLFSEIVNVRTSFNFQVLIISYRGSMSTTLARGFFWKQTYPWILLEWFLFVFSNIIQKYICHINTACTIYSYKATSNKSKKPIAGNWSLSIILKKKGIGKRTDTRDITFMINKYFLFKKSIILFSASHSLFSPQVLILEMRS